MASMSARVWYYVESLRAGEPETKQKRMTASDCAGLGMGAVMGRIAALRVGMKKRSPTGWISNIDLCQSVRPRNRRVRATELRRDTNKTRT